jgi:putative addiction module killer protein
MNGECKFTFRRSAEFNARLRGLKDFRAVAAIARCLDNASKGNFGKAKAVGEGISELQFHFGPGYRV